MKERLKRYLEKASEGFFKNKRMSTWIRRAFIRRIEKNF